MSYTDRHHTDDPPLCPLCLRPMYQKHLETCSGPAQRIAPPSVPDAGSECGCNAGGMHEPDCGWVTGRLSERGSGQEALGARSDAPGVGETPASTRSESLTGETGT